MYSNQPGKTVSSRPVLRLRLPYLVFVLVLPLFPLLPLPPSSLEGDVVVTAPVSQATLSVTTLDA